MEGMMIPIPGEGEQGGGGGDGGGGGGEFLPFDAVMEILSRLPVKSLARSRCVCKPWCSLTYDPIFVKKHHLMAASTTSTLFSDRRNRNTPITLCDFGGRDGEITEYAPPPPHEDLLKSYVLSNSIDGLICGFKARVLFLLNPSARDFAWLPSPPKRNMPSIGLGFDASTGKYKVLRISLSEGSYMEFQCAVLTVGADQKWRSIGKSPTRFPPRDRFYFNGFIYWLDRGEELTGVPAVLGAFDCRQETLFSITIPESARFKPAEVVSFRGKICFAGVHNSSLTILVLEDYARPVWAPLFVINCDFLSTALTEHRIIGVKDGKLLLQGTWKQEDGCMMIYSYDLCRKVWSQMICRRGFQELRLYAESLVSPRNLLKQHVE